MIVVNEDGMVIEENGRGNELSTPTKPKNVIHAWLKKEDRWLHDVLDELARKMTEEQGYKTSKSDLVRNALLKMYGHLKP